MNAPESDTEEPSLFLFSMNGRLLHRVTLQNPLSQLVCTRDGKPGKEGAAAHTLHVTVVNHVRKHSCHAMPQE